MQTPPDVYTHVRSSFVVLLLDLVVPFMSRANCRRARTSSTFPAEVPLAADTQLCLLLEKNVGHLSKLNAVRACWAL